MIPTSPDCYPYAQDVLSDIADAAANYQDIPEISRSGFLTDRRIHRAEMRIRNHLTSGGLGPAQYTELLVEELANVARGKGMIHLNGFLEEYLDRLKGLHRSKGWVGQDRRRK